MDIRSILGFMQRHDANGNWLEWLSEIERGESEYDNGYVFDTLQAWYEDSGENVYLDMLNNLLAE